VRARRRERRRGEAQGRVVYRVSGRASLSSCQDRANIATVSRTTSATVYLCKQPDNTRPSTRRGGGIDVGSLISGGSVFLTKLPACVTLLWHERACATTASDKSRARDFPRSPVDAPPLPRETSIIARSGTRPVSAIVRQKIPRALHI